MSHPALVAVRTFLSAIDAELAQSALEAAGIESMVRADDFGGLRPHMQMSEGVELLVREEDAEDARRILSDPSHAEHEDSSRKGHKDH